MDDVELFTFPGSNAGLTVELLLMHAGVPYRERRLRAGLHVVSLKRRGFPGRTVPAARIGGVRVQGSRAISCAIAERCPEVGLLPSGAAARDQVLAAERDAERFQIAARRLVYTVAQDHPEVVRPLIDESFGFTPEFARGALCRTLVFAASRAHGASHDRIDRELLCIGELLERFDNLVESGVMGGDTPNVADFQLAPNLALLALADNVAPVLQQRPCWQVAAQLLPRYPLDVTVRAPDEWVRLLKAVS